MSKKVRSTKEGALRVVELFAGVGGFRVGLEAAGGFDVVWSNQWEPGRKAQHASDVYVSRFGAEGHVCSDIAMVKASHIPDHDVLVGGFPCQDYSVASTLKNARGLVGKKGVLWWQIHRILTEKKHKPRYLLLENVDRLLGSPAGQRGRDLAVMLSSLNALGYEVEWRVVNAADLGLPQRRKRVFIFGEHTGSKALKLKDPEEHLLRDGFFARAFGEAHPTTPLHAYMLEGDLAKITRSFNTGGHRSPFHSAGVMRNGQVWTMTVKLPEPSDPTTLGDVLLDEKDVPKSYFIPKGHMAKWRYLKGAKREQRASATGHKYHYSEGAMTFPDALDRPSRTIVTGEGGPGPSRFKHVVQTTDGRYRRLTPVELERLNMFPDGHTEGAADGWRAFFMGNALVTGVVTLLGKALRQQHQRTAKARR